MCSNKYSHTDSHCPRLTLLLLNSQELRRHRLLSSSLQRLRLLFPEMYHRIVMTHSNSDMHVTKLRPHHERKSNQKKKEFETSTLPPYPAIAPPNPKLRISWNLDERISTFDLSNELIRPPLSLAAQPLKEELNIIRVDPWILKEDLSSGASFWFWLGALSQEKRIPYILTSLHPLEERQDT